MSLALHGPVEERPLPSLPTTPARSPRLGATSLLFCLAVGAAFEAGCASDGVPFHLRSRPEFAEADRTISVFGFFKDGQMTADAEPSLGPKPWSFLGASGCDVAYAPALVSTNPGLARAVDEYARNNGITDDLLAVFGPAAEGQMIMVVTMAGHVTTNEADAGGETPPAAQPSSSPRRGGGGGRGGRRGGGSMPSSTGHSRAVDRGAIELSASFYAVGAQRSVAIADTRYVGPSTETAWKTFSTKLGTAVPGATCRGWNLQAGLDTKRLQHLIEQDTASSSPE